MKLIDLKELTKRSLTKPNQLINEKIIGEKDNATKLQGVFVIVPPGASGSKLHYHTQRESFVLVLSGEGKEVIDGKEYSVTANDAIFILPNEKHKIVNTGNEELKYFELYTLPSDFIAAE